MNRAAEQGKGLNLQLVKLHWQQEQRSSARTVRPWAGRALHTVLDEPFANRFYTYVIHQLCCIEALSVSIVHHTSFSLSLGPTASMGRASFRRKLEHARASFLPLFRRYGYLKAKRAQRYLIAKAVVEEFALLQAEESSRWGQLKAQLNNSSGANRQVVNAAVISFLNIPLITFFYLSAGMKAVYDTGEWPAGRGEDMEDLLAMVLRRYQVVGGTDSLRKDFGCSRTVLNRDLRLGRELLNLFLMNYDQSGQPSYPTLAEAEAMFARVCKEHGEVPTVEGVPFVLRPMVLAAEVLTTPLAAPVSKEDESLYAGGSTGPCLKHILIFRADGRLCSYSINHPGSMSDSWAASELMDWHRSEGINPDKLGMVVEGRFKEYAGGEDNTLDKAFICRPLIHKEKIAAELLPAAVAFSDWLTSLRRFSLAAHCQLKTAFPYICSSINLSERQSFTTDLENILHLHSMLASAKQSRPEEDGVMLAEDGESFVDKLAAGTEDFDAYCKAGLDHLLLAWGGKKGPAPGTFKIVPAGKARAEED